MSGIFRDKPKPPSPGPSLATFAVVVADEIGRPVQGAGVILSIGKDGVTNQDGYVSFVVPVGTLSFSVHHHLFKRYDEIVPVLANKQVAILLETIDDAGGQPRPPAGGLDVWPRYGISAPCFNTKHNLPEIVRIYNNSGVTLTRINLLSTAWTNPSNFLPFTRLSDGRWDLYRWDARYFDRIVEVKERMNEAGIVVQWTNYELYSWSKRKASPIQAVNPWVNNVNGVQWSPEDTTLYTLPDAWSVAWFEKVVPVLSLRPNVFEIGNEFPEKGLHVRAAQAIRKIQPDALISVNRNEDTPGQYRNMKIGGKDFDLIAFHGRQLKQPSDWKRVYKNEVGKDLDADDIPTFHEMLSPVRKQQGTVDPKRIIFSSDGARSSEDPVDTYDWDKLRAFFREAKRLGCSIEHQSRAKMTTAPNHHMIEAEWFESVIA